MNTLERCISKIRKDNRLKHIEKLLLIYLLDISGETGSCHMTMRALSAETGISIGAISEAIPRLKDNGYIKAAKALGSSGHESWQIDIIDYQQSEAQQFQVTPTAQSIKTQHGDLTITIKIEANVKE